MTSVQGQGTRFTVTLAVVGAEPVTTADALEREDSIVREFMRQLGIAAANR